MGKPKSKKELEILNLCNSTAKFVYPKLKTLIEVKKTFPAEFETLDEWKVILNKILYSMEIYATDKNFDLDLKDSAKIKEGFLLFGKYFEYLWD